MQTNGILFRLSAALAVGGLLLGPAAAPVARAQTDENSTAAADPPARVGWLAQVNGTVSFRTTDDTDWSPAELNYPVTSGNAFWTEPGASASLTIGGSTIALDQGTEVDVTTIDDHTLVATVPQGSVFLNLTDLQQGDSYQISTPRGVVTISQNGHYEVVSGDTDTATAVTVVDGAAQVQTSGSTETLALQPHQSAQISGADTFQAKVVTAANDAFVTAQIAPPPAPPPAPANSAPPPPVVAQMTGGAALAHIGEWQPTPQYGNVWYPPVQAGWVPYRQGRWAYVAPWGWTWVDQAPWGFAPFHYGRWVQVGPRWGWVASEPGIAVSVRPVYAPALVAFVGLGAGVAVGAAIGASVGWIPLGPREVYRPPYRVSNNYVRNVNVTNVNVRNVTIINNNTTTINNFANRRAATVVPATAMTSSRQVAQVARPMTQQQLAAARPVAEVPVRPTAATAGVTPAVARQLKLPPAPRPAPGAVAPVRPAAPGPVVQAQAKGAPVKLRSPSPVRPAAAQPGRPAAPATEAKPAVVQPGTPGTPPPAAETKPAVVQPGRPGAPPPAPEAKPAVVQPGRPGMPPPAAETKPAVVQPGRPGAPPPAPEAKPAVVQPGKPGTPPPATETKPAVVQPGKPGTPPPAAEPKPAVVQPGKPGAPPAPEAKPAPAPKPAVVQPGRPVPAPPAAEAKPAPAPKPAVVQPPRPATPAPKPPVAQPARPVTPPPAAAKPAPPAAPAPRPAPAPAPRPAPAPAARPAPVPAPAPKPAPAPAAAPRPAPAPPAAKPAPAAAKPPAKACPAGQTTC